MTTFERTNAWLITFSKTYPFEYYGGNRFWIFSKWANCAPVAPEVKIRQFMGTNK